MFYFLSVKTILAVFIRSDRALGGLIERGPNTLQTGNEDLERLIDELNLSDQLVTADPAARNRYVLHDGTTMSCANNTPIIH